MKMNRKHTKRALLSSVLALVLCFSMMLGTTFAWFTDSVESTNNIIKAGNLDIELYYQVEGQSDWTKVTADSNIFMKDALWEPGHTEVVKLKVVNEGTLVLKYQMGVNVAGETTSKSVTGKDLKLSEFIKYGIVEGAQTYTRDQAVAAVDATATKLSAAYSTEMIELAAKNDGDTDEKIVTMVVYMPTSVDNDANYAKGEKIPTINLGINLYATQKDAESDSFGPDYDKESAVSTVAEAEAMMAENKPVVLAGCNEPDSVLNVPATYTETLTLVNSTIKSVQAEENVNIVIQGNVVVNATGNGIATLAANTEVFDGSAITANGVLNISGSGTLTAIAADEKGAFGIGGMKTTEINIEGITIEKVTGSFVQQNFVNDTSYGKSEPEGGAAIGSGSTGAKINLKNVTVNEALGGSKAAGIGARYWTGVVINIENSVISKVVGGNASAGIGGSRVSDDPAHNQDVVIHIKDSRVTAFGGQFAAGIGSGYDTHCAGNLTTLPKCEINITGNSVINATGGKYGAGIGTGYHTAGLSGSIADSVTVNAVGGGHREKYTVAMDVGFGVIDMTREGAKAAGSGIAYNGSTITVQDAPVGTASQDAVKEALAKGSDVVLTADVVLDDVMEITAETNIDLNGKKLTVSHLEAKANVTITGGTLVHSESDYPAVAVQDGGKLILNDVAVVSENYCNIMTSGSREAAEYVGIQIFGGECVLTDCDITVKIDKLRFANSAIGVGIHGGSLTMNGGSITVESVGSTNAQYDSQAAIFAGSDTAKTITLNNVTVTAKDFLHAAKGSITVNTTDAQGSWDGKVYQTGGTYVINYAG